MIVRPQQHWLRRIFVWHGSVLSKISSRLLLNFLFSIAVIFMLPWYTHLGIKFTLAPFSILGVAIAIFLGFRNNAGYARYVEARKLWGQLMIASRSLLREVKTTLPDSASVREFARLQIAFAHCLRMTLRKQPQAEVLAQYLKTEDSPATPWQAAPPPDAIVQRQSVDIKRGSSQTFFYSRQRVTPIVDKTDKFASRHHPIEQTFFTRPGH
ncbi:TPA: bestrophin family ion channel [Escherichia coli]